VAPPRTGAGDADEVADLGAGAPIGPGIGYEFGYAGADRYEARGHLPGSPRRLARRWRAVKAGCERSYQSRSSARWRMSAWRGLRVPGTIAGAADARGRFGDSKDGL
jgi:hypothetical protein